MNLRNRYRYGFFTLLLTIGLILSACVGSTPNPAPCSAAFLITALNNANATPATEDTINLSPGCLYELTAVDNLTDGPNGLPSIVSPVVINGNGAIIQRSFASGIPAFRIFHVSNIGMLTLNDLTISNGLAHSVTTGATAPNAGGGIYNNNRTSLYGVVIDDNHAKLGGGIYNTMANGITIDNSTFQYNGADVENTAGERGGGIYNLSSLTITKSTFVGNKATETGGAIENGGSGRLAISNSTISGNATAMLAGSAILNSGEIIVMSYTTITNNTGGAPGAALMSGPDTIEIRNSIIANNTGGNCSYPATSTVLWENLDSDGSCNGFTITDNPALDPLANNGGPTLTHALLPFSPAVDAAAGNCSTTDQRGEPRPEGPACDLGAYELTGGGPTPAPTVIPASVEGYVFLDMNGNGLRDAVEIAASTGIIGANIALMEGQCPGTSLHAASHSVSPDGIYGFGMLMPGTYCILTDPQQMVLTPSMQEITVGNNDHLFDVNFYMPDPGLPPTSAASSRCDLFETIDISLVLLNIPPATMVLPVNIRMTGGVPGLGIPFPDDPEPWEYNALLGSIESNICSLQGFEDRLYCMLPIPPEAPGLAMDFFLYLKGCDDPVFMKPNLTIPEIHSTPKCSSDLEKEACEAAGGKMSTSVSTAPTCICP
ncbi:MAG: hypothetical protein MUO54_16475 [Anaerolineales bacterium]|nr:hypothetical protein [Anaerolineales bacterium]